MDMFLKMAKKMMMVFEQVVKVEVCLSEGFACDIVADGHQTVCRQKFSSHRCLILICSFMLPCVTTVLSHNTTQHNKTQHNTTQQNTTQHSLCTQHNNKMSQTPQIAIPTGCWHSTGLASSTWTLFSFQPPVFVIRLGLP